MAKDDPVTEVNGLQLSNNTFSASPPGSLLKAEGCVMPQKGVIEPARGQDRHYTGPTSTDIAFSTTEFSGTVIGNWGTSKTDTSFQLAAGGTPSSAYAAGPYNPVDSDGISTSWQRMKFGFAGEYMHFCTTTGPKTLENPGDSQARTSGLLQMPDAYGNANAFGGTADWLAYGSSVAVRVVNTRLTSNGTKLISPPSGPVVITNRILLPIGALAKAGGTATGTLPGGQRTGLAPGDTFDLDPGEANFPATTYTVLTTPTDSSFTFAITAGTASNTVAQDCDTGPRGVTVNALLPDDAAVGDVVREYRSVATSTVSPSDELFLANEATLDNSDLVAGQYAFGDGTPQSALVDPLYTNQQLGAGADQANFQPPIYRDLASWGERMWYANTTAQHEIRMQLLGVGSPAGIQNNDTLTIDDGTNDETFTFKTSPSLAFDVQIVSSGTPSQNIAATLENLIITFVGNVPSSYGWGIYKTGTAQNPGSFVIRRTDYGEDALGVTASRPGSWIPALDSSVAVESVAERLPNGLAYSKLGQAEAVPPVNFLQIGSKNYAIARIVGLKQALLVFKEGDGIYSLTGSFPFQVQQISTANIIAPDACSQFADAAWAYTDQGFLRVSDSGGATVVSRQIETVLDEQRAEFPDETYDYSFTVPYETERRILLFVPFDVDDATSRPNLRAWCYNNATQAWTGPLYGDAFSGVVSPTLDKLLLGTYDTEFLQGRITLERKGSIPAYLDYANAGISGVYSISAVDVGDDPLVIRIPGSSALDAGDGIVQGDWRTRIEEKFTVSNVEYLRLYEEVPFTVGAVTVYKRIEAELMFLPQGSPAQRKVLTRLAWLFKPEWFQTLSGLSVLLTDQTQAEAEIETAFGGFGLNTTASGGGFGVTPFGDPTPLVVDVNPLPPAWTNAAQFFAGFRIAEAWPKVKLQGFVLTLGDATSPVGRGR